MFKGNRKKYDISQGKQRFSIRKFKFGAASIAIAFMVGGQAVVSAAEPNTVTSDTAVNANVIPAKESKATMQDVTSQPTATTETPKAEIPKAEIPKAETPKEEVKKEKEKTSDTSLDNELKTPNLDINQLIRGGARTVAEDGGDVWGSRLGNVRTGSNEFNDGALKNIKHYISEDKHASSNIEIENGYRTIGKTMITAKYVEENGKKYIDYDVYFQNDGKKLNGSTRNAFWFYGPRDIMHLKNGAYDSDTITQRRYTRYRLKDGKTAFLSQNPSAFDQIGDTFTIPDGSFDQKSAPKNWGGYTLYELGAGPVRDDQRQQMLKQLENNAELNSIIKKNGSYPSASFSQTLTIDNGNDYAYKYHVRVRLRDNVTKEEAEKSGVMAVTGKAGLAQNALQAYVYAAMGSKLGKTQSEEYSPVGNLLTVQKGHKITAEDLSKHITHKEGTKPLPAGYTVEAISVPETNSVGDYTAQALVRYPDGSREFVNVPVKVVDKDTQAPTLTVNPDKITVKKGEDIKFTVTATDDQDVELQLKDLLSKFEKAFLTTRVEYKYTTKTATKVVLEVTIKKAQLDDTKTVTFGAVDKAGHKVEKNLDITVIEPDKDKYQPEYPSAAGKPGDTVEVPVKEKEGKTIPTGTTFTTPSGTGITVDKETGKVTVKIPADKKPGDVIEGKVTVTYPDGTTDEVPVKVTVKEKPTDADTHEPKGKDQTVKTGETPKAEDSIANIPDLPKGTKFEFESPVDTTTPGDKTAKVKVTYPDGSKDEVTVTIHVEKKATDADTHEPKGKDQTVKTGETPKAEDSIANIPDLPKGTKFEFESPVDTTTPGDKTAKVKVTYPDGSKDEVTVTIHVEKKATDADTHEPKGKDQTVKTGETPKAEDSIANIPDLPKGTKFEFESPVDTTTPGDKTAKVKVTYPDGSKDEVTVTIHVEKKATDGNHSNGDDVTGNQINSATKTLPNTGSTVNPFFTAAAMAAIVGAGTLYGVARKKHEDDAND